MSALGGGGGAVRRQPGSWLSGLGSGVPWRISPKPEGSSRSLTNLIPMRITIYDVEDIEGFVNDMAQLVVKFTNQEEWDELICEGIALLLNMAKNFVPWKPGYDKPGKFSGYCAAYLPRKISNAWYKMHPEHIQETITLDDGSKKKRYRHGQAPGSLPELDGEDERIRTLGEFIHI